MPRVLHVYKTYYPDAPGGIQEAIRQICLATAPLGVENSIFALSPQPLPATVVHREGPVHRARSWLAPASCDLGGPGAFSLFAQQARKADIIHYHHPWPFAGLLHSLTGPAGKPAVLTYHSDVVRQRLLGLLYAPLRQRHLGAMDALVATSPPYAAGSPTLRALSLSPRVRVIPLGMADQAGAKSDDGLRRRLGLAADSFFLFLGALRYYKGLQYLLEAAVMVKAPVVVAGGGPEQPAWRRQAEKLGARRVFFTGPVNEAEKRDLLNNCRALVLPSHLRSEAFGLVLVEAAMAGRPQISCEIGTGTSWVNKHMQTGLVVPPADPVALAAAMRQLQHNDRLAARLGSGARRRYEQKFSATALGGAYHQLYHQVMNKRNHR